ncbi:cyclin 11 [Perkinsela sp. CCAP 1560/4]|nr:cyclin 11 [Perkinsela sp. CCAP 1560/4]|eukprot:KNH04734.1 cyclin 11 [Perkinsela sp. CCAP 1560/4]
MCSCQDKRNVFLFELIQAPICCDAGLRQSVKAACARRALFYHSPTEREFDVVSKSGRSLSEIEIFHIKHHPEFEQLIPSIIDALQQVIVAHHGRVGLQAGYPQGPFKLFETSQKPQISLKDYVRRIAEHTYTSPASILSSFIYLDRLIQKFDLVITELNVFKLFFLAVRVASKVIELRTLNNKNFAGVGGITNKHLNELEALFVSTLEFDILISPLEFQRYSSRLYKHDCCGV